MTYRESLNLVAGQLIRTTYINMPGFLYRVCEVNATDPIGGAKKLIAAHPQCGDMSRVHYLLPRDVEVAQ